MDESIDETKIIYFEDFRKRYVTQEELDYLIGALELMSSHIVRLQDDVDRINQELFELRGDKLC